MAVSRQGAPAWDVAAAAAAAVEAVTASPRCAVGSAPQSWLQLWHRRWLRLALVSMACKFLTSYMHERVIGMKRCASPRPPSLPIQRLQAQSDATALCATNNDGHCFSAAFSDSLAKCERGRGGRVALLPLCSWLVGAS